MFTDYVRDVMQRLASFDIIDDKLPYYGSIQGFRGVWAQGKTLKKCEENLRDVPEEWILLKIRKKQIVPQS